MGIMHIDEEVNMHVSLERLRASIKDPLGPLVKGDLPNSQSVDAVIQPSPPTDMTPDPSA